MRPAIHATLSALVGWTANSTAARNAGQVAPIQRRSVTNARAATAPCHSVFIT